MTLPSDIARCCESGCERRADCARWGERQTGRAYALLGGDADGVPDTDCPFFIPMESAHDQS